MSRTLRLAVIQAALPGERDANLQIVDRLVRRAAAEGAQVVLAPELFDGPYFPSTLDVAHRGRAMPSSGHPTIEAMRVLARELEIVIPTSFYERDGDRVFNSVAMLDADGSLLGVYRKSHIPAGPGYEEKDCFEAGDTGFRCWTTRYASIGVGICWDQWFPEAARAMVLEGADLLLYPSTIGSEPEDPEVDTSGPWQRVMLGHAVANAVPVAAANRVGREANLEFYGSSFVADHRGEVVARLSRDREEVAVVPIDLTEAREYRRAWGFFNDRRPELYSALVEPKASDDG